MFRPRILRSGVIGTSNRVKIVGDTEWAWASGSGARSLPQGLTAPGPAACASRYVATASHSDSRSTSRTDARRCTTGALNT